MRAVSLIGLMLLVLVLLNLRRTAWPAIKQDFEVIRVFLTQPEAIDARKAFYRMILGAALSAYVSYLIIVTFFAVISHR